jgi:hypothetical protein
MKAAVNNTLIGIQYWAKLSSMKFDDHEAKLTSLSPSPFGSETP